MGQLVDVIGTEFARAASTVPDVKEVERSKAQLKTGLLMSFESSVARAEQMARQLLAHDRLLSAEELIARVEAVTPQSIRAVAEQLVASSKMSFVLVGAGRGGAAVASRAIERGSNGV